MVAKDEDKPAEGLQGVFFDDVTGFYEAVVTICCALRLFPFIFCHHSHAFLITFATTPTPVITFAVIPLPLA